jgi:hypothetical protein
MGWVKHAADYFIEALTPALAVGWIVAALLAILALVRAGLVGRAVAGDEFPQLLAVAVLLALAWAVLRGWAYG